MILITLAARPEPVPDVEARVDAVIALYAKGDRAGARSAADELARTDPAEPRVWLLLGMLAEDKKDLDEAERFYARSLDLLDPGDVRRVDIRVTLADLLRRKGNAEGALAAIDKVARETGESGRIRHARVLSLIALGRFDEALSQTQLIAEEKFGGGVAKKLEKQIRSLMDAKQKRGG
jgi:Flp pilus assembly protein TadD